MNEQYKIITGIKREIKALKLDQNNYRVWSQIMKLNLIERRLWRIVNDIVIQSGVTE